MIGDLYSGYYGTTCFPTAYFFFSLSTLDQPNPLEYRTPIPTPVLFLQSVPVADTILITLWLAGLQLFEKGEEVLPCMDSCGFEPKITGSFAKAFTRAAVKVAI